MTILPSACTAIASTEPAMSRIRCGLGCSVCAVAACRNRPRLAMTVAGKVLRGDKAVSAMVGMHYGANKRGGMPHPLATSRLTCTSWHSGNLDVFPAKAVIQRLWGCDEALGSRLRGNDDFF